MIAPPAGRPAAGIALLALVLLAALGGAWQPRRAFADDPAKPVAKAAKAAMPVPQTVDELEGRINKHLPSLLAAIALRWVACTVGLVLLVLAWIRARDVRRGLLPPPPPRPPPTTPFSPAQGLMLFFGGIVLVEGIGVAVYSVSGTAPLPTWGRLVATALPMLPIAGLVLWGRRRALERGGGGGPVPAGEAVRKGLWTLLVASLVSTVVGLLWGLLLLAAGRRPEPQELVTLVSDGSLSDAVLISAFGVLVAPFTEECLFRGLLYPTVRAFLVRAGRLPPAVTPARAAAVLVAVLFAAIHVNLFAFVPLVALAIMLAWLFERTDSILAVTVAHATFNASTLVPLLFLRSA